MADTLRTRVTRILAGSAHSLLDTLEGKQPEAMLRQSIREIDVVLTETRVDLGKVEAAKHLVTSQINKLNSQNEELGTQIETALDRGEDNLARAGIERQLLIEDQVPVLTTSLAEQRDKAQELEGFITALLAKKREMEQALQAYLASKTASPTSPNSTDRLRKEGRVENAQSTFDRVIARETGVTGLTGDLGDAHKLKQLQDLQRDTRVEERLTQLKARSQQ